MFEFVANVEYNENKKVSNCYVNCDSAWHGGWSRPKWHLVSYMKLALGKGNIIWEKFGSWYTGYSA